MKMKKINNTLGVYTESLRQLRTFGIVVLCISLFFTVAAGISNLSYMMIDHNFGMLIDTSTACGAIYFVCFLAAPVMTLSIFAWMNSRKSSDFYHALPYKRESIFLGMFAAVFTWCVGLILINFAVGLGFYAVFPNIFITDYHDALKILLSVLAVALLFISSVSLAMSITGTRLSNIIVSLLIIFAPRGIISIVVDTVYSSSDALVSDYVPFLLKGECNLLYSFFGAFSFITSELNMRAVLYTFLLAVVYGCFSLLLFKKRKSEMAHTSAPTRTVQAVYRIAAAFVFCLMLVSRAVSYGFSIDIIIGFGFVVIAYFVFELIMTKKWKNLVRAIPGLFVVAALCVCSYFVIDIAKDKMLAFSPEASEIGYVKLIGNGYDSYYSYLYSDSIDFYDYATGLGSEVELRDEEVKEIVSSNLRYTLDNEHYSYRNSAVFKIECGGREYARRVYMSDSAYYNLKQALSEHEDYKKGFVTLPEMKGIYYRGDHDSRQRLPDALYDILREDISSASFTEWMTYLSDGYSYYNEWVYILSEVDGRSTFVSVPLSVRLTPKSIAAYLEYTDNFRRRGECLEYLESIPSLVDKAIDENNEYAYYSVSVEAYMPDGTIAWRNWWFDLRDYERSDDVIYESKFDDFRGEEYSEFLDVLRETDDKKTDTDAYIVVNCYGYFGKDGEYVDLTAYYPLTDDNVGYFKAWDYESVEMIIR